jgi:hypothetical protein
MIKLVRGRSLVEQPWNKFQECVQYGTYLLSPYGVSSRRQKLVPPNLLLLLILTRKVILHRQHNTKECFLWFMLQINIFHGIFTCAGFARGRRLLFCFYDFEIPDTRFYHSIQNLNEFEFERNSEKCSSRLPNV